jgi:hypothetical protein
MIAETEPEIEKIACSVGKPIEVTIYPGKVMSEEELTTWLRGDEVTAERRKQKDGNSRKFKIRKTKRLAVYLRDSFTCAFCGIDMKGCDPRLITLDHIKPRTKGGTDDPKNLVTACLRCNCQKKDQNITKFAGAEKAKAIRKQARQDIEPLRKTALAIVKGLSGYGD